MKCLIIGTIPPINSSSLKSYRLPIINYIVATQHNKEKAWIENNLPEHY